MQPIRRDVKFDFSNADMGNWHGDGPAVSHFLNALSVVFPDGERFFIESVRNFRNQVTDPELKTAITAFIGQEAMHGREHESWNRHYFEHVPGAIKVDDFAKSRLKRWQKWLPKTTQLAMTIGAEHITAVLGDFILRNPEFLEGHGKTPSHAEFVAMLGWHAMEETEHKAVAFDVWNSVMRNTPRAYVERSFGLLFMLAAYAPVINQLVIEGLKVERERTGTAPDLVPLRSYLSGKKGLFRRIALPVLSYFKPGFHPWDDDNRELLAPLDALAMNYAA